MVAATAAAAAGGGGIQQILTAVEEGRFQELAALCDRTELEEATRGALFPPSWPFTLHLLAHLFSDDLSSARFLWKRIPAPAKASDAELAAAWAVGQAMWRQERAASANERAAVFSALGSFSWSQSVQPLAEALKAHLRQKMLSLLSKSYSSISISDASAMLGLTPDEAKSLNQKGWLLDADTFIISATVEEKGEKTKSDQLQNLTEYIFHLEH